jgi:hypothetical protein
MSPSTAIAAILAALLLGAMTVYRSGTLTSG